MLGSGTLPLMATLSPSTMASSAEKPKIYLGKPWSVAVVPLKEAFSFGALFAGRALNHLGKPCAVRLLSSLREAE